MVTLTNAPCQICFESADIAVTQICTKFCRAIVCLPCISRYIELKIESLIAGIAVPLPCPVCKRPTNLVRWKEILGNFSHVIVAYEQRIELACHILCPHCHNMRSTLPQQSDSMPLISLPSEMARKTSELRQRCGRFCRHHLSAKEFYQFVVDTFYGHVEKVILSILPLIHDVERRVALYLVYTRKHPFILSPCCAARLCFVCKIGYHHIGKPCEPLESKEDIAQCPNCDLYLVKGDGCDEVTCFCGHPFSWAFEKTQFRLQLMRSEALEKLHHFVAICKWWYAQKIFKRKLRLTEALFFAYLECVTPGIGTELDQWIGINNGVFLGMPCDDFISCIPENLNLSWTSEWDIMGNEYPYCYIYLSQVASMFPGLPPDYYYVKESMAYFTFDLNQTLQSIAFCFEPAYVHGWYVNEVPLRHYFSRLFGYECEDDDTLFDKGDLIISIEKKNGLIYVDIVLTASAPMFENRQYTKYLQYKRMCEFITPLHQRKIRKAMMQVKQYLLTKVWQKRFEQVIDVIRKGFIPHYCAKV